MAPICQRSELALNCSTSCALVSSPLYAFSTSCADASIYSASARGVEHELCVSACIVRVQIAALATNWRGMHHHPPLSRYCAFSPIVRILLGINHHQINLSVAACRLRDGLVIFGVLKIGKASSARTIESTVALGLALTADHPTKQPALGF